MIARRRRGSGLVDAMLALALAGLVLAGAAALCGRALQRARAPAAARLAASDFRNLRSEAVARGIQRALRFDRDETSGTWTVTLVEDGDGDGVLTEDVRRGIDRELTEPMPLQQRWGLQPGYASSLRTLRSPPPDLDPLDHLRDPVRFGRRDIVSCSPRGTITPGTVYLSDGAHRQFAVVVHGSTARVRTWEYLLGSREWVQR